MGPNALKLCSKQCRINAVFLLLFYSGQSSFAYFLVTVVLMGFIVTIVLAKFSRSFFLRGVCCNPCAVQEEVYSLTSLDMATCMALVCDFWDDEKSDFGYEKLK